MRKVLIAVDNTKSSKGILSLFDDLVTLPESIVLLHVQQLEGNYLMTAMLSDSEVSTLRESLKGTEYKKKLDEQAVRVLTHCKNVLINGGLVNIKTVIREGHPSEEILRTAEEEKVDLVVVGCSGKSRLQKLVTGCASKEVEKNAKVPVLIAKGDGCGEHSHFWNGREAYAIR